MATASLPSLCRATCRHACIVVWICATLLNAMTCAPVLPPSVPTFIPAFHSYSLRRYSRIYDANPDYTPNQLSAGGKPEATVPIHTQVDQVCNSDPGKPVAVSMCRRRRGER